MAALDSTIKLANQTAAAIDSAVLARSGDGMRPHLGASIIGQPCERKIWYTFRWAKQSNHEARILRLFARGQREESSLTSLLRQAGVQVVDVDRTTGDQFQFSDIGGHFGGSMDGACTGLQEHPEEWFVLEFKTHGKKSFDDLSKKFLKEAKPEHYDQMQCYMHWTGMCQGLYVAVCKDDDRLHLEIVKSDPARADSLIAKAQRIIESQDPPERMSQDSSYYLCKWCDYASICHESSVPLPTCRSCCHSTPEMKGDATWSCSKHKSNLDINKQKKGCESHLFIPSLLGKFGEVLDASLPENWVQYENKVSGSLFKNGIPTDCFSSHEIFMVENKGALTEESVMQLRKEFDARLVA